MRDDLKFRSHGTVDKGFRFTVVDLLGNIALEESCLKIRGIAALSSCLYHDLNVTFVLGDLGAVMKTFIN